VFVHGSPDPYARVVLTSESCYVRVVRIPGLGYASAVVTCG
jgi:hypothetical protein